MIHIYGQGRWHQEAAILGTRDDLIKLADAINAAVDGSSAKIDTFTNDGEGYEIHIAADSKENIDRLTLPYTDITVEQQVSPWEFFPKHTQPQKVVPEDLNLDLRILDWVLEEQMAGRSPDTLDVARHFEITVVEAQKIHDDLEKAGEFD